MTADLGAVFQIPSKENKSGIGSFGDVVDVCVCHLRSDKNWMPREGWLGTCFRISLLRL